MCLDRVHLCSCFSYLRPMRLLAAGNNSSFVWLACSTIPRMIIGIDANPANREQRTGTEWYAFNLIQALKKQPLETDERVVLYSAEPLRDDLKQLPANWESRVLHWPFKRFWTQGRFSFEMLHRPVDVLFVPAHVIPRIHPHSKKKQRATVTTIHDLAFRRLPGLYEPKKRRYLNWSTRFAARHAAALLVPS